MGMIRKISSFIRTNLLLWLSAIIGFPIVTMIARLIYAHGYKLYVGKLEENDVVLKNIIIILVLVFVALLISNFFEYMTRYFRKKFKIIVSASMRQNIFSSIQKGVLYKTSNYTNGEILTRYDKDTELATSMITDDIVSCIYPIIVGLGYIISIFLVNVYIGLIVFILVTSIIILNKFFVEYIRKLNIKYLKYESEFNNLYQNTLRGKMSVRLINAQEKMCYMLDEKSKNIRKIEYQIAKVESYKIITLDLFSKICSTLMIPISCIFYIKGRMSIPDVVLIAQLCRDIVVHISGFGNAISDLKSHEISLDRILDIMNIKHEDVSNIKYDNYTRKNVNNIRINNNDINKNMTIYDIIDYNNKNYDSKMLIKYDNVSIKYGHKQIVNNKNIEFNRGEIVIFSGESGSGKSSLIKALLGFVEYDGNIFYGGINIRDIPINYLRSKISFVPEKSDMFEGTILDNIMFGNLDTTKEEIHTVLSKVGIESEIDLDYNVGVEGINLSGGQRQRIAIARALVKEFSTIILDEPTASLDNNSEKIILDTLIKLKEDGKCIIIITHRESTLAIADKIVYL